MHRAAFARAQRVSGCTASVGMHSWTLEYANSGLDVLHAAQKSPQTLEARFHSPPASHTPVTSGGQAEYSPGTAQGHRRRHGVLQHPHCWPWRCHVATWAPATHKPGLGEGGESKGNHSLSPVGPALCLLFMRDWHRARRSGLGGRPGAEWQAPVPAGRPGDPGVPERLVLF